MIFASPVYVGSIEELAASHMRGPQIAVTKAGVTIIAANNAGDIFSFLIDSTGKWQKLGKVNDVDTVAKEGLMALGGDGGLLFAAWLDLRNGQNEIYGSRSIDGGKTWSKNIRVYASPDSTVCECCKPSVVVKGDHVYVMFRNWLKGARDLYIAGSTNTGNTFNAPQKLGNGSWQLDACPMDGGGLTANAGIVETVWRRESKIYACTLGKEEKMIGEGKGCTMETVNGKNYYVWAESKNIVFLPEGGEKKIIGEGMLPILKRSDNKHLICVWENDKRIQSYKIDL